MANYNDFVLPNTRRVLERPPLSILEIAGRQAAANLSDAVYPPRGGEIPNFTPADQGADPVLESGEIPTFSPAAMRNNASPEMLLKHSAAPSLPDVSVPELKMPGGAMETPLNVDKDIIDNVLGTGGKSVGELSAYANRNFKATPAADRPWAEGAAIGNRQILTDPRLRQIAFQNTGGVIKGGPTDSSLDAEAARAAQRRAAQLAITTPAAPMSPVAPPASAPAGHFAGPRGSGDSTLQEAAWLNALGENADPEVPVAILNPEVPLAGGEPTTKEGAMALRALAMRGQIKKINDLKRAQAAMPLNEQAPMPIRTLLPKPSPVVPSAATLTAAVGAAPGAPPAVAPGVPAESAADRVAALIGQKPTPVLNKAGLTGNQQLALDQEDAWDKFRQDRRDRNSGLQRWQNDAARANWQLARDRTNVEADRVGAAAAAAASANALQAAQIKAQNDIALAKLKQEGELTREGMGVQKEDMLHKRRQVAVKMLSEAQAAVANAEQEAQNAEALAGGLTHTAEGIAAAQKRRFAETMKSQLAILMQNVAPDLMLPAKGVTEQAAPQAGPAVPGAVDAALGTGKPAAAAAAPVLSPQDQAIKQEVEARGGRFSDQSVDLRRKQQHNNLMTRVMRAPGSPQAKAAEYFKNNPQPTPQEFSELAAHVGIDAAREARRAYINENVWPDTLFYTDDPNSRPWITPPFGTHWVNPPGY